MIATPATHGPCYVFDANGLRWERIRWVDTETGEAEQTVLDDLGQVLVDYERRCVVTQRVRLAAPVLLMPKRR